MSKLKKIPFKILIKTISSNKIIFTGLFISSITGFLLATFLSNMDPHDEKYKSKEVIICNGIINDISETNTSVNNNKIYRYTFNYKLNGETLQGHSFSEHIEKSISDTVQIEYISENHNISRIIGTRNGSFKKDEILNMLLSFFIVGLLLTLFMFYKKLLLIRTLKNGFKIVPAKLDYEIKFPTLPNIRSNPYYRLTFNYSIDNHKYKKNVIAQVSDFHIRRVRHSSILIDIENHNKGFIMELLPEDLMIFILEQSTIPSK